MKHHCPICGKPTDSETIPEFPFCGDRCRQIDLGNWATEKYVISESAFDEDDFEKLMLDENEEERGNAQPKSKGESHSKDSNDSP